MEYQQIVRAFLRIRNKACVGCEQFRSIGSLRVHSHYVNILIDIAEYPVIKRRATKLRLPLEK